MSYYYCPKNTPLALKRKRLKEQRECGRTGHKVHVSLLKVWLNVIDYRRGCTCGLVCDIWPMRTGYAINVSGKLLT
jgi:hypothetical protein